MEKVGRRRRAKAASEATVEAEPVVDALPQEEVKKTRRTKRKQEIPQPIDENQTPELENLPAPSPKKRGKRAKAKDIIAELQAEEQEPLVSPEDEKPARKSGRRGRKKQPEDTEGAETVPPEEETLQIEKPAKKTTKKRTKKPAPETTETETAPSEEAPQPTPIIKPVEEPKPQPSLQIQPTPSRLRARTRTKEIEKQVLLEREPEGPKAENAQTGQISVPDEKIQQTKDVPIDTSSPADAKKIKAGGARIVRPKETVAVVKTVTTETQQAVEQVEKKVVEIVRREAGPRIVKPPEAAIQEQQLAAKRKKTAEGATQPAKVNKTSKKETQNEKPSNGETKADKKEIDFKTIHQKEASKLESIIDFQKRLHQRHIMMSANDSAVKCPVVASIRAEATSAPVGRSPSLRGSSQPAGPRVPISALPKPIFAKQPKENVDTAAIIKRTGQMTLSTPKQATVLAAQSSNIPILTNKPSHELKVEKTPKPAASRPKTTTIDNAENVLNPRTPRNRPATQLVTKTPSNQGKNPPGAENNLNSAQKGSLVSAAPQMPAQLATSSFIRRKSFDLNASLSRRLGYKPYIGKLKPIETTLKPVVPASGNVSIIKSNLNCTKN